ncbi:P-loop containing nucleoside triphosphate hydrolase protein [Microdochium trichocladiopsis]|uniref:P-loop containing nucleoside triphosphate hydrolase protein n=1 Tax=Microdochium trichocladiopsis TaxID=1682393 RepID=A0A9P8Y4H5_9PEZI|nr:P-loop containing nucleoside triphosphate hydrolase protein [Microdochium trichocladiopsis]KAH7027455.1 P-loop containing nucleoside triphosphate hydrolase protein [Microdochium trichocladiopsis]
MAPQSTLLLATSAAGLGVVGLLSIPAALNILEQLHKKEPYDPDTVYEDADGKSTPEATKAFSAKWPKAFILFFSAAGLLVSIALGVLAIISDNKLANTLFLENWLCVGTWALLLFQAIAIASARSSVVAHDLGIYSMLASVALLVVRVIQDNQVGETLLKHDITTFAIRVAEIVVVVALGFSSLQLPRRPDVYDGDQVIDRSLTQSAWSRYNWSWAFNVLQAAKEKNNLDMKDLPRPDHYTRARPATEAWENRGFKGPLWLSIIKAHKGTLALQWFLTLCTSVLNFAPQWCVLQLLRILERRTKESDALGYDAWMWVIWIGVTIVLQSWVESHVFWLSYGQLCVKVRAELSALVFKKSMRRKDVKEAKKKSTPTTSTPELTVTGPAGVSTSVDTPEVASPADEEEEEDPEQLKKSKQGTVNLIGVDAKRVADFCAFANYFPGSLFKLIVSLTFLLDLLGWKALVAGFSTMIAVMPINIYFSKRYSDAQDRLMKVRDTKLEVVSEALQGIRQIKFAALEPQWEDKISKVRERELSAIWYAFINDCMLIGCWICSPIMLAAVSLAVYAYVHGSLLPSVAFVSLGVFKALEVTLSVIPELTTDALDAWVSVNRIDTYLNSAEVTKISKDAEEISFDNASIAWPSDDTEENPDRFILRNMNFTFPKGELSVVSGKTGSGKSLLLASILGEVDLLEGSMSVPRAPAIQDRHDHKANKDNWYIPGSIAFVAQIPWIENATVKENILFGLPLDEERYKLTVEVCALTKDIEMFTDGDRTEIGANGINLSGGQKWRITLARAMYSRAGILVLDDIFSAVDAHVGRHIFEACLTGELGKGRTRILVTHHVALCESRTKYLVELGNGVVLNAGPVEELKEDGTLAKIKSHEQSPREIQEDEDMTAVNSEEVSVNDADGTEPLVKVPSKTPEARKFVEEEARERGSIKKKVYATYLHDSGGWPFWTGAAVIFLVVMALGLGRSWWLKVWTDSYEETESIDVHSNGSHDYSYASQMILKESTLHLLSKPIIPVENDDSLTFYLGIYVLLAGVTCIISTSRWYYVFSGSIVASRTLFAKINFVVLRAPLRWLDTVPVGRVLNRFTADFHSVDTHLAYALGFGIGAILNLVAVIIAGLFVSPLLILLSFVLLAICLWYALFYLHGARPVKRLESTAKSPVFEQFTSALTGVTTIRGFDKSDVYIERMFRKIDDWSTSSWHLWLFNRWMGWRMSVVGSFFASFVAILILLTPDMHASLAGFALAFALDFSASVMWTIRHYATIELEMNAAERIVEYTELPTEKLDGDNAPATWPTEGRVELNDLVVTYADDLPPVLKGLTFSVNSNERVGVVGRTGAGKSSLTLALFRFLEAKGGSIHVDGLDISKIKLHDLRSRLAIIPQDPVLFSGTVRSNLDPFDNHTDEELLDCLARVHLISEDETRPPSGAETPGVPSSGTATPTTAAAPKKNTNIFRKLSSPISEGGLNLSQGQRQLLCLARAIVSRPKVMVLDEATSAVDMNTDALIQRSIREEFGGSTLLVIAHRLSTIADFDRILVLSDGKVAEYGSPKELWDLKPKDGGEFGMFRAMCEESGEKEKLRKICLGLSE